MPLPSYTQGPWNNVHMASQQEGPQPRHLDSSPRGFPHDQQQLRVSLPCGMSQ